MDVPSGPPPPMEGGPPAFDVEFHSSNARVDRVLDRYRGQTKSSRDIAMIEVFVHFDGLTRPLLVPNPRVHRKNVAVVWQHDVKKALGLQGALSDSLGALSHVTSFVACGNGALAGSLPASMVQIQLLGDSRSDSTSRVTTTGAVASAAAAASHFLRFAEDENVFFPRDVILPLNFITHRVYVLSDEISLK